MASENRSRGINWLQRQLPAVLISALGMTASACTTGPAQAPPPVARTYDAQTPPAPSASEQAPTPTEQVTTPSVVVTVEPTQTLEQPSVDDRNESPDSETILSGLPENIEQASHDQFYELGSAMAKSMLGHFGAAKPAEEVNSGDEGAISITEINSVDGKMSVSVDQSAPGAASLQIVYSDPDKGQKLLLNLEELRGAKGDEKATVADFLAALQDGEFRIVTIEYRDNGAAGTVQTNPNSISALTVMSDKGSEQDATSAIKRLLATINTGRPEA